MMGDIVHLPDGDMTLDVDLTCSAPIERVDIFNGLDLPKPSGPIGKKSLATVFESFGKGRNIEAGSGR